MISRLSPGNPINRLMKLVCGLEGPLKTTTSTLWLHDAVEVFVDQDAVPGGFKRELAGMVIGEVTHGADHRAFGPRTYVDRKGSRTADSASTCSPSSVISTSGNDDASTTGPEYEGQDKGDDDRLECLFDRFVSGPLGRPAKQGGWVVVEGTAPRVGIRAAFYPSNAAGVGEQERNSETCPFPSGKRVAGTPAG